MWKFGGNEQEKYDGPDNSESQNYTDKSLQVYRLKTGGIWAGCTLIWEDEITFWSMKLVDCQKKLTTLNCNK